MIKHVKLFCVRHSWRSFDIHAWLYDPFFWPYVYKMLTFYVLVTVTIIWTHLHVMNYLYLKMARSRASASRPQWAYERWHLSSVEVFEDSKIPNAATIKIVKQDHTLGNMLRAYVVHRAFPFLYWYPTSQLLAMPQVTFAGYKVPHPLEPYFVIKIQTNGQQTPSDVLNKACVTVISIATSLEKKFEEALNKVRRDIVAAQSLYL